MELKERLYGMAEYATLSAERQKALALPFAEFSDSIERHTLIAVIRDTARRFEETDYPRQLSRLTAWAQPATQAAQVAAISGQNPGVMIDASHDLPKQEVPTPHAKPEHPVEYISRRAVPVRFDKAWLADESDVERYLESMREAFLVAIRSGKRIQI